MPEMLLICAIALIVIGPKKLPDLAKSLGRAFGEFKRATSDLKDSLEIDTDFSDVSKPFNEITDDIKDSLDTPVDSAANDSSTADYTEDKKEYESTESDSTDRINYTNSDADAAEVQEDDTEPDTPPESEEGTDKR